MDTLRGPFGSDTNGEGHDFDDLHDLTGDASEGEASRDLPPAAIGQDERRMQVRAYNHWAGLLGDRTFPSIEDLEPADLPDFGPYSVLLDFSQGIEDPLIQYLGATLANECGTDAHIERLSDVPPRSLLSRITDHYLQIMANQAPIGFEAEFVNQRGASILYRGILLPYSSDDESIDFIYGVINWKEMADAATADELLLEIDQALENEEAELETQGPQHHEDALADWADSPAHEAGEDEEMVMPGADMMDDNILDLGANGVEIEEEDGDLPMPDFGQYGLDDPDEDEEEEDESDSGGFASLANYLKAPAKKAIDLDADKFDPADYQVDGSASDEAAMDVEPEGLVSPLPEGYEPESYEPEVYEPEGYEPEADEQGVQEPHAEVEPTQAVEQVASVPLGVFAEDASNEDVADEDAAYELPEDASIHDCLASARELAQSARVSEDRSRHALYAAVGRAYDFSLAAKDAPEDYDALIEESGLTVQDRAPMTPVVKLVFGSDYDKTRLTEYAAVLSHAHRLEIERGSLADYLTRAEGGLKGVVNAERRLRREESGKPVEPEDVIREALAKKLRQLEALMVAAEGPEFSLVMVRRDGEGSVDFVGEIADDTALIERAARKLVG